MIPYALVASDFPLTSDSTKATSTLAWPKPLNPLYEPVPAEIAVAQLVRSHVTLHSSCSLNQLRPISLTEHELGGHPSCRQVRSGLITG